MQRGYRASAGNQVTVGVGEGADRAVATANPRDNGQHEDAVHSLTSDLVDMLSVGRRARAKWEQGDRIEAMFDGVAGAAELYLAGVGARGLLKGQFKLRGPLKWRTKPWEDGEGARQWMGRKGILKPGQHGHHAIIPNNGWGKSVPDAIKNQPANIKPMPSAETHGRIHGNYKGNPQFNIVERYWHGTPTWWKAMNAAVAAHAAKAAEDLQKKMQEEVQGFQSRFQEQSPPAKVPKPNSISTKSPSGPI